MYIFSVAHFFPALLPRERRETQPLPLLPGLHWSLWPDSIVVADLENLQAVLNQINSKPQKPKPANPQPLNSVPLRPDTMIPKDPIIRRSTSVPPGIDVDL